MKRILDVILSIVGLLLLSPVFLITAALIKLDSDGPVFFQQERVGRFGRYFNILKFRTMVNNAQSIGASITIGNDSRITRCGNYLRKYKLDELPQLINVLKGDMSLVGPRPEVAEYVKYYPEDVKHRVLSVRPGITDVASLKFLNEAKMLSEAEDPLRCYVDEILPIKLKYYTEYVDNRSLIKDFSIIVSTILSILSQR